MVSSKSVYFLLFLFLLSFGPQTASGESDPGPKGNLEGSYLQTDGNTESVSFSGGGKAEWTKNRSKLSGEAKGIYGKKDGETSEKNWFSRLRYDYLVSDRASVFLMETAERDTLKGIEFRFNHQAGAGYDLVKTEKDLLRFEGGVGYVTENRVPPFGSRGYPALIVLGKYNHDFTEKTRFEQTVEYIPNLREGSDYLINEETALITNLFGRFALKASFAVTFDNQPPPDFKKSDRVFRTSLLYTF